MVSTIQRKTNISLSISYLIFPFMMTLPSSANLPMRYNLWCLTRRLLLSWTIIIQNNPVSLCSRLIAAFRQSVQQCLTYDAAVLCAGICGFGLGATPNAMANMSAVCYKYRYTVKPFLIVPIIGAMFADLINTGMITLFLNIL